MSDDERDRRTGPQVLRSVLSYLEFRAGTSWRHLDSSADRWSAERWYYVSGIREIHSALGKVANSPTPHLVANTSTDELRAERLLAYGRPELVRRLMSLRSDLTDRRLLSRFGRLKLARMVVAAENLAADEERAIA